MSDAPAPARTPHLAAPSIPDGVVRLSHLGVIRADGPDAAGFLHGQLSQDFALLRPGQARLAAFCSAKGRMLATFVGFAHGPDSILLLCSRDLLAPTLKRLSMFVLRAKVRLSDATNEFQIWGCTGLAISSIAGNDLPAWTTATMGTQTVVGLYPAAGEARALVVSPVDAQPPAGQPLPPGLWDWSEVQSGVATLSAPVVDAFVPQMLNYESVGGVNFKKGCYPGQEVVARSQFRGTLKRRTFIVHANSGLQPGQDVFHEGDADQPCGTVVQAAAAPSGGFDALVSIQVQAASGGLLQTAGGNALELATLPYPLLDDI